METGARMELTEARLALADLFERIWPDPDDPLPPASACLDRWADELDALERHYRRAQYICARRAKCDAGVVPWPDSGYNNSAETP